MKSGLIVDLGDVRKDGFFRKNISYLHKQEFSFPSFLLIEKLIKKESNKEEMVLQDSECGGGYRRTNWRPRQSTG